MNPSTANAESKVPGSEREPVSYMYLPPVSAFGLGAVLWVSKPVDCAGVVSMLNFNKDLVWKLPTTEDGTCRLKKV